MVGSYVSEKRVNTRIKHTERVYTMSRIRNAKENLVSAREIFEREKREEWLTLSARLETALEDAVWAGKQAGMTISALAAEYGTKDRGTIYRLLAKRDFGTHGSATGTAWTLEDGVYSVTGMGSTLRFTVDDVNDPWPMFITTDPGYETNTKLFNELRSPDSALLKRVVENA